MKYEVIIGLEFHVQLKTKTKMFCGCANDSQAKEPNLNICPICLGHPGTLPTVNEQAINWAIKAGLALSCRINKFTKFDRKNYFYPDLPKGYQISQYDKPLAEEGHFTINFVEPDGLAGRLDNEDELKRINIIRLHMEEDSAKSIHSPDNTLIDFNRASAPLIEIVTAPDFSSPQEAKTFAQELQLLMRTLEISNANMEDGQLRCDANISLRPENDNNLYPKIEIKNINSFNSLEKALAYEIKRQKALWEENKAPKIQETRGWDDKKQITVAQRTKETQADYRYFPEPDIPPLTFTDEQIQEIKNTLPEMPQEKRYRFVADYNLTPEQAKLICAEKKSADFFEQTISELQEWISTSFNTEKNTWEENKNKLINLTVNWLINNLFVLMNDKKINFNNLKITAENFAEFITLLFEKKITSTNAQKILEIMFDKGADPSHVLQEYSFEQIQDQGAIEKIIQKVIEENPKQVEQYKQGKEAILKYLVGQVMKESKGNANPQTAQEMLIKNLK